MKKRLILLLCLSFLYASVFSTAVSANDPLTIRVGVYENNPKIFTDDKGNVSGFWPEIIEYIAAEEGWRIEYIHGTWPECLTRLEKNEIDVMPDVGYTEERNALYNFSSETVLVSWSRVYAKEGSNIQSILDLEGKNIAVLKGSINVEGPEGIKQLVRKFEINCTFTEVDSYTKVFELLDSKEADAGVTNKDFGNASENKYNVERTSIIFLPSHIQFAFPKDSSLAPYLAERIDYHIKELKEDKGSLYYQLLEKWLGVKPAEKSVIPGWMLWVLAGLGGLALLLGGGSIILRSQVRARTKELMSDITERKRVEEALRQSEQKYRTLVENIPQTIFYKDRKLAYISCNENYARDLKIKPNEITGKTDYDFYPKDLAEKYRADDRRIIDSDKPEIIEEKYIEDGKDRFVETHKTTVKDDKGDVIGVLGIFRDITERKQTQRLEAEAEAAKLANQVKSEFLASMSHELRTPLNAVIGFAQVLQEQYFGQLNEKQAEYVNDILESGRHLLSLINDVLDLSKIEAGKEELELSTVNIKELLQGSLVMVKEKALKHGISLSLQVTADIDGLEIRVDERKVKQVMFNLLSNAAKFTPDGGAITVEGRKQGEEVIISVSDTGIGIAPQDQKKLFQRFYQVHSSTTDKTLGTGLGLALAKHLTEMHGGRIWVESEGEGKGSRFSFTLPVHGMSAGKTIET